MVVFEANNFFSPIEWYNSDPTAITTSYSTKNINESKPNLNLDQKYAFPRHGNARHVEHGFMKNKLGTEEKRTVDRSHGRI